MCIPYYHYLPILHESNTIPDKIEHSFESAEYNSFLPLFAFHMPSHALTCLHMPSYAFSYEVWTSH